MTLITIMKLVLWNDKRYVDFDKMSSSSSFGQNLQEAIPYLSPAPSHLILILIYLPAFSIIPQTIPINHQFLSQTLLVFKSLWDQT